MQASLLPHGGGAFGPRHRIFFGHHDHEKETDMARHLLSKLTRALTAEWTPDPVHFHGGAHGRPYVCDDPRCVSPGLDAAQR
jgi:hypothetical protein